MAEAQSQGQPFTIKILEGRDKGKVIELVGRALPYRGVVYETTQRGKTRYYPGNPVATQQILGPVDEPVTINGIWKDVFLGDGIARALVDTFDGVARSGFQVEIAWGANTVSGDVAFTRVGYIKKFKTTWDRPQDVGWEIVFELRGRDEPAAPPFTSSGLIAMREGFDATRVTFEDALDQIEAFQESPFAQIFGIQQSVESALDTAQTRAAEVINALNDTSDALQGNVDIPGNIAERVRSLCSAGASAMLNLTATMAGTLGSVEDAWATVRAIESDLAIAWLNFQNIIFALFHTNDTAAESANNLSSAIAKQQRPDVIAEVQPIAGTDLRELATEFYDDPELWWIIADYNSLSSSRVPDLPTGPSDQSPATFTIKIPQRPQGIAGTVHPSC
jgi:hypothetical protein